MGTQAQSHLDSGHLSCTRVITSRFQSHHGERTSQSQHEAREPRLYRQATRLMSREVVTEYFNKYVGAVSSGRIEADGFREIFNLAFPSRPLEKLDILIKELVDEDDTIAIGQLLVLLYMFSDGKTTDNLTQMFKLFDADNSGFICLN